MPVETLRRLTRDWWRRDRVRVAPGEGRLLRLQPPCYLWIAGRPAEVFNRRLDAERAGLVYDCLVDGEHAELRVRFTGLRRPPVLHWLTEDGRHELEPDQVQVFAPE